MKKSYKGLSLILNLVCLIFMQPGGLSALDPHKAITQYSVRIRNMESGLPTNTVYAVQQTRDGYLWIGTQEGLVRFDGIHFHIFNESNVEQLKSNDIRALCEDADGVLWIGTSSGGLARYRDGEFSAYPITTYPALYEISALCADRWNNLWIGSFKHGLTCMSKGEFTTYTTKDGLPHDKVHFIQKDGNGDLWVSTMGGIVKLLKPGVFQVYAAGNDFPHNRTVCLYDESKRDLWVGTFNSGLFRLTAENREAYGLKEGIPNPTITYLYQDSRKKLWIGTDGGGLARMDNGKFSAISKGNGLACGYVYSIYEDKEGSLWLGTIDGGLHQLRDGKFTTYTAREGLTHDYIECIYPDRAGRLWIGTKAGLNRLNPADGAVSTLLTTGEKTVQGSITCLAESPSGEILVGTWGGGILVYHAGTFTASPWNKRLAGKNIGCMLTDKQGNTWIGTDNGLYRLDKRTGKWTIFQKTQGLSSNYIEVIYEDSRGKLWIGTDSGLNQFDNGVITGYDPGGSEAHHFIRCAFEDNRGVLWFGADSGLIRRRENENSLEIFTAQNGLLENYIYSITEDGNGYIWLGGRNGISRIKKNTFAAFSSGKIERLEPDWFNEKDGMKNRWCTRAGCKTRDGRFWFPTGGGLSVIDPEDIKINTVPPAIILEQLVADGEIFHVNKKGNKSLVLSPGKKRLEFYYTSVSFINPQDIRFKLKLEGYDKDWLSMGTARTTTYTGLQPGHYTFRVTACNPDGIWNGEGSSISFYLRPYFYQALWFYFLVGMCVLLAVFFLFRLRVRHLKTRERELSTLVEMRTHDLKERTVELEKAHEKLHQSKEIIETKNRHIMDSIRYAREIQQAMLPTNKKMAGELKEFFVIFKPKDIVSGDFYWFDAVDNQYFLAVADCTGHGVPGALLSAIGSMMLKDVVRDKRILDPAQILLHLHREFRSVLEREMDVKENDTYDGMDLGLCRIDLAAGKITFAGARRPLFYMDSSALIEIKGNRQSIGGRQRSEKRFFTDHDVEIPVTENGEKEIMIYLTTDGFADQHNPLNEKFGTRRLKECLQTWGQLELPLQKEKLLQALTAHQDAEEQRDDITIIGIRLRNPPG